MTEEFDVIAGQFVDNSDVDNTLEHYGTKRRSGRYPWGSGINPYQHEAFFEGFRSLKLQGLSEKEIADKWGVSTKELRMMNSIAGDCARRQKLAEVKSMKAEGLSNVEIGKRLGISESSVRSLFDERAESRMNVAKNTADFLRSQVEEKGMIDVGKGTERELGVSREKMDEALYMLEIEGYKVYGAGVAQVTNKGQQTIVEVLAPKDSERKDIYNFEDIHTITDYKSTDNGETYWQMEYPSKLSSERIKIVYKDEVGLDGHTGSEKDGLIEIRPGLKDISLGETAHYAQVRILADGEKYGLEGDRYLKGMAVYSDNIPDGYDVVVNASKTPDQVGRVLKKAESDPINPFGATIKNYGQQHYVDNNGVEQLGYVNKKNDEGDWDQWSRTLPSQFLSKQRPELVKRQLKLSIAERKEELAEIEALDNPTVKKKLLETYASSCDSQAVSLSAAALPRQRYQVILPMNSLSEHEIYAPNYKDGEQVALVRFPHGGTFEIPVLTVNNKNKEGKAMISGSAIDAIGINAKAAARLSGADFDGDTVLVIPTNDKVSIKATPALKGLEGFDPHVEYAKKPGMKVMTKRNTQLEMGSITNLITDMTVKGATDEELAAAVRHSMVVIDAAKHELDYKQSYADNHIQDLKDKYQAHINPDTGRIGYGATTIISRASAQASRTKRQGSGHINKETGEWIFKDTTRISDKTGKLLTEETTQMANTVDARTLVSDTKNPIENAYANYANSLKALANEARKSMVNTKSIDKSPQAKVTYVNEIDSLNNKLDIALRNKPKERKAQLLANTWIDTKVSNNPGLLEDKEKYKKEAQKLLVAARRQVGAERHAIDITPKEWEAIQAGAISDTKLSEILNYTDIDVVRQYATPKKTNSLTTTQINMIKNMAASGFTNEEISQRLGVSTSSITKYMK